MAVSPGPSPGKVPANELVSVLSCKSIAALRFYRETCTDFQPKSYILVFVVQLSKNRNLQILDLRNKHLTVSMCVNLNIYPVSDINIKILKKKLKMYEF